jgi:hypothetical protein
VSRLSPSLIGWLLFLASSAGFVISSYRSGDVAALAGSVLFFAGCIAFLLPARSG